MGLETKNPSVSGLTIGSEGLVVGSTANFNSNLNVNGGAIFNKMSNNNITIYTGDFSGQYYGQSKYLELQGLNGVVHYLRFYKGFLVEVD